MTFGRSKRKSTKATLDSREDRPLSWRPEPAIMTAARAQIDTTETANMTDHALHENGTLPSASKTRLDEFEDYRDRMNARIGGIDHLGVKRFFALDSAAYREGALPSATKELLGLVASVVLRCNDCIDYHLGQCVAAGFSDDEIVDALNVGLVVGGSIVIPHFRHAMETIDLLRGRERRAVAGDQGSVVR